MRILHVTLAALCIFGASACVSYDAGTYRELAAVNVGATTVTEQSCVDLAQGAEALTDEEGEDTVLNVPFGRGPVLKRHAHRHEQAAAACKRVTTAPDTTQEGRATAADAIGRIWTTGLQILGDN
jgi:hypothetical protein